MHVVTVPISEQRLRGMSLESLVNSSPSIFPYDIEEADVQSSKSS